MPVFPAHEPHEEESNTRKRRMKEICLYTLKHDSFSDVRESDLDSIQHALFDSSSLFLLSLSTAIMHPIETKLGQFFSFSDFFCVPRHRVENRKQKRNGGAVADVIAG